MPAYICRHGAMKYLGIFQPLNGAEYTRGQHVVLRTERGTETGEVLCPSTAQAEATLPEPTRGEILRVMSAEDDARAKQVLANQLSAYAKGTGLVLQHKLLMQIVEVECLFGGEKIVFFFLADGRVDFRELVKSMAREFKTRIELRQIGVRDEAKLLADYGDCGKPVCCNSHMAVMPPVSMRMAKLQKSTLDPNKISGRCGRLKCCLRFEQDVYEEFLAELPAIGVRVVTKVGPGRVLAQEILARRVLVEFEDGRRLPIPADDVLSTL
jgi:cell fate regulator YaaT (PSP1 superfamily)